MPQECKNCGSEFPYEKEINGKVRNLSSRQYCLDCSPFGEHNTRQLHVDKRTKQDGKCEFCGKEYKIDNSKGTRRNRCGVCRDKLTGIRNNIRLIHDKGGQCEECGYSFCKAALDFHHSSPESKEFKISSHLSDFGYSKLAGEAEKCRLLCSNCHRLYHGSKQKEACGCGNCKACKQRETRHKRKWRAVRNKGTKCMACDTEIHSLKIVTFHHREPEDKTFTLSGNNFARSWEVIKRELSKCDLLCSNCHKSKHCTGSEFCNHNHGRFSEVGLPD